MSDEPYRMLVLDQAELIRFMIEGVTGGDLHSGEFADMTASQALDSLGMHEAQRESLKSTAGRLVDYFTRCVNEGGGVAHNMGLVKPAKVVQ
jgi:hypothetical protein